MAEKNDTNKEKTTQTNTEYSAKNIKILEGLEAVRKRPAMYIGDTGEAGLHHLVYEVVDNSIDEAMAGNCKNIDIVIKKDNSILVKDDGRGIPIEMHESGISALEVVLTKLHAGGKFDKDSYKVSGGLHGVGISVVNALSESLEVEVSRNGAVHFQKFKRGVPEHKMKITGTTNKTGTQVKFKPDNEIFPIIIFDYERLSSRLRELAFLNAGIRISIFDERDEKNKDTFEYEGGIKSFVEYLNRNKNALHSIIYFKKEERGVEVEISLQYTAAYSANVLTFANNINTIEGGTHLSGFKSALTRTINEYISSNKLSKEEKLAGNDLNEGLTAVISVKVPEPQFEGQTKTKLGNISIKGIVETVVNEQLKYYLEENPAEARSISEKVLTSLRARMAAKKAKDLIRRKGVLESSILPGKLADCTEKDPDKCEIYLVEGNSAGGCFSGDTKIALTDGRNITFKELVKEHKKGKKNYCYTIIEDGTIGIKLIKHPRITKRNVEVVKIILDNDEEIVCTPDHKFMTRENTYIKADKLNNQISLMPLNRKFSKIEGRITIKGYEMVYDPTKKKWIFTHLLSDKYNILNQKYSKEEGCYKHHIDFNKLNNNPENIIRMTKEEHLKLHSILYKKTLHTKSAKQKAKEAHKTPEYRRKLSKIMSTPKMKKMLSKRAKKQWEDEEYKTYMSKKYIEFYNNNDEYRKRLLKRLNKAQMEYWAIEENRIIQSKRAIKYFKEHPEHKEKLSKISKKQWDNPELKKWRSTKTKQQWTNGFREKRKKAYDKTYFKHTIGFMNSILSMYGNLKKYKEERIKSKNKNLLKQETFIKRFFRGNEETMLEAVKNYNHKIKKIMKLKKKINVYDLEVEETHNFALASGIFVHNSAKQGRDREFQAILPLRGKVLNVEKAPIHKILANKEIQTMIRAFGTSVGDDFNIAKLRYGKIIIMTDADVDGAHIRTLLLTFLYRYLTELVEKGHIYSANPPLYRIKKGKYIKYVYSDEELEEVLDKIGEKGTSYQRFKGLGEMNPDQLWKTTMDPKTRTLTKITIADAALADELFNILMGTEVEPRREFIQKHAKEVKNIDI